MGSINDISSIVFSLAFDLEKSQYKSGAWEEEKPSLNAIILTTQATLFLSEFKCGFFNANIIKSCEWMTKPDVASSQYSYWRLLPLFRCPKDSDLINQAWEHAHECVNQELQHHENSPLPMFFVYCSAMLGKELNGKYKELYDEFEASLRAPENRVSAETISYQLLALANVNKKLATQLMPTALEHIEKKAHRTAARIHWANLVSSAYVTLNLIELSQLLHVPKNDNLFTMINNSINYLFTEYKEGRLDSQLLAGGENEINSREYSAIVCCRAFVSYLNFIADGWQQRYWASRYRRSRTYLEYTIILAVAMGLFAISRAFSLPSFSWLGNVDILSEGADFIAWLTLVFGLGRWAWNKFGLHNKAIQATGRSAGA